MRDSADPVRRGLALVGAVVDGDEVATRALAPGDSPAVGHLWVIDPLAAAGVEPEEQDVRRRLTYPARISGFGCRGPRRIR
jgi:hypothetical protein